MPKVSKPFLVILAFATGAVFLFSAYTKMYPTIQAFEYNIASQAGWPYMAASIAARFFIGLEAGLGSLILFHYFGRNNWVLKASFALVAGFTLYLVWLWMKMGNNINCGCFGNNIWMNPSTSIIKNIILLLAIAALIRWHKGIIWSNMIPVVHLLCMFSLAYLLIPLFTRYKLNSTAIYAAPKFAPSIDLTKGKHIIAFASPECSHCRKAASMMHEMSIKNPAIPFFIVIGDTTADLTEFWQASNAQDVLHSRIGEEPFDKYTGGEYPQIIWVNNGMVEANTTYPELDQKVIEQWMK